MKLCDLSEELSASSYPGRGIILGRSENNRYAAIAYFIMGRSENSRNRVFEWQEDGIRTKAFDPAKLVDPSLIIYEPVRVFKGKTIVTNGDQTDTVYDFLQDGKGFVEALHTRTFEPDGPNFTPRVSGIVLPNGDFRLSILKSDRNDESTTLRYFYDYENPKAGEGRYIHTYVGNGNPLPSFEGEPTLVTLPGNLDTFTETVWNHLDPDNKVSLFTRFIDLKTGKTESRIYNKNGNTKLSKESMTNLETEESCHA